MPTPTTGLISMYHVATEAKLNLIAGPASLDDQEVRKLCNRRAGQISMDDLHNRAYGVGLGYIQTTFTDVGAAETATVLSNVVVIAAAGSTAVSAYVVTDAPLGVKYRINGGAWQVSATPATLKNDDTIQLMMQVDQYTTQTAQVRFGAVVLPWVVSAGQFSTVQLSVTYASPTSSGVSSTGRISISTAQTGGDILTGFAEDGSTSWKQLLPERTGTSRVAVNATGDTYVLRTGGPSAPAAGSLLKFSIAGALLWNFNLGASGSGMFSSMSTAGTRVAVGGLYQNFACVAVFEATGALSWAKKFPSGSQILAVVGDESGNVYVAGVSDTGASDIAAFVIKFSPTGSVLWQKGLNSVDSDVPTAYTGLAVDDTANVYLMTSAHSPPPSRALAKISAGGTMQWSTTLPFLYGRNLFVAQDGVYAMGVNQDQTYSDTVFRYSTADGSLSGIGNVQACPIATHTATANAVYDSGTLYRNGISDLITPSFSAAEEAVYAATISLALTSTTVPVISVAYGPF